MIRALRSARVHDTRAELTTWMAKRSHRGNGPPESLGPFVMSEVDLAAFFGVKRETIQKNVISLPRMKLGKCRYYRISDIADWMVQKETESE